MQEKQWPPKAEKFLTDLYRSVGAEKVEQKVTLMEHLLGPAHMYAGVEGPTLEQRLGGYEYEILAEQGLIELVLV